MPACITAWETSISPIWVIFITERCMIKFYVSQISYSPSCLRHCGRAAEVSSYQPFCMLPSLDHLPAGLAALVSHFNWQRASVISEEDSCLIAVSINLSIWVFRAISMKILFLYICRIQKTFTVNCWGLVCVMFDWIMCLKILFNTMIYWYYTTYMCALLMIYFPHFQHRDYRILILNLTPSLSRQVMCEVSDWSMLCLRFECVSVMSVIHMCILWSWCNTLPFTSWIMQLCVQAVQKNLSQYVWIIPGWYPQGWWLGGISLSCSDDMLERFIEGGNVLSVLQSPSKTLSKVSIVITTTTKPMYSERESAIIFMAYMIGRIVSIILLCDYLHRNLLNSTRGLDPVA